MKDFTRLLEELYIKDCQLSLTTDGPEITLIVDDKITVKNHPDMSNTIEVGGVVIFSTRGENETMHGYYIEKELTRLLKCIRHDTGEYE